MKIMENKKIIVTGATGGIGNSIVKLLYENGAKILATGTRIEKLEKLKSEFKSLEILKFDISKNDKIEEFIDNATSQLGGGLDCIINNAGTTKDNLAIRMSKAKKDEKTANEAILSIGKNGAMCPNE